LYFSSLSSTGNSIHTTIGSECELNSKIDGVYGLRGYSFDMVFDEDELEIVKDGGSGDILKTQGNLTFSISKLMTTHKPNDTLNVNTVILGKGSSTSAGGTLSKVQYKATSTGQFKVVLRNIIFFADDGVFTIPDVTYRILAHKRITETRLLQNFPNPFNPETWIPYELHTDADVKIKIYDISGQLVRTINMGYQPAGVYTTKANAAYWDGKNQLGEEIASGVYLYQFNIGFDTQATQPKGKHSFVRKMTLLK